ncbi:MAG TPA: hypothetical protein VGC57_07710 [Cellulomonas sp.]
MSPTARATEALLLIGTVGVGKTTVADAVGDLLVAQRTPHAVIDLDELRRSWPRPTDDPFDQVLELENLTAVATAYRRRGARRLVLAGVLERPGDRPAYAAAAGMPLVVCRLRADVDLVRARLVSRHDGHEAELAWHLHRAGELDAVLAAAGIEDHVVDVDPHTPASAAAAVLHAVGWARDA